MDSPERIAVRNTLDELRPYVAAFVSQHYRMLEDSTTKDANRRQGRTDVQGLLRAVIEQWATVFSSLLPNVARSYAFELIDIRNRWAHEEPFTREEAARAIDTARQFATALGVPTSSTKTRNANSTWQCAARSATSSSQKRSSQRAVMRSIYAACSGDIERTISGYAAAERNGTVVRKSDISGMSPDAYARALLLDGLKKGWLDAARNAVGDPS